MSFTVKELLHAAAYLPVEIDQLLDPEHPSFVCFDPVLGYVLKDYVFRDGIDNSLSCYAYEPGGQRKMINYVDQPCRINTYGDSYTQCAQVSDGETWQEILAAHFREPIRNFGVGGYGFYQAYRRALDIEENAHLSADNIVVMIWDDNHLRNLDASRWIRVIGVFKELPRGAGKDTYQVHGFPWAHIRYHLDKKDFVELPGACKVPEDLRKLTDKDYYYELFKDDEIVHLFTLRNGGDAPIDKLQALATAFGVDVNLKDPGRRVRDAEKLHITYGLNASKWILARLKAWSRKKAKNLLIVLTYDYPTTRTYLEEGRRFDQEIVDYLKDNAFNYFDTLPEVKKEYAAFSLSPEQFLDRIYLPRAGAQVFGHWNPMGNFCFAQWLRPKLIDWLDPKPPAYR